MADDASPSAFSLGSEGQAFWVYTFDRAQTWPSKVPFFQEGPKSSSSHQQHILSPQAAP